MFCRNCGKELSGKSEQIICTACGVSVDDGWSQWTYKGLLLLSFILPIFGWIYGGINIKQSVNNSKKEKQAWALVFAGFFAVAINIFFMLNR